MLDSMDLEKERAFTITHPVTMSYTPRMPEIYD